jgi:hypothetical protein
MCTQSLPMREETSGCYLDVSFLCSTQDTGEQTSIAVLFYDCATLSFLKTDDHACYQACRMAFWLQSEAITSLYYCRPLLLLRCNITAKALYSCF